MRPGDLIVSFVVLGIPRTAGSKRIVPLRGKAGGKPILIDDAGAKGVAWKRMVAMAGLVAMRRAGERIIVGQPLAVRFVFFRARPKAHFDAAGDVKPSHLSAIPIAKPDLLKTARAVEDALSGIVWADDALIAMESMERVYGLTPGVKIEVFTIARNALDSETRR
jgi:Holliday junction resolvase RusA-like endonuclease